MPVGTFMERRGRDHLTNWEDTEPGHSGLITLAGLGNACGAHFCLRPSRSRQLPQERSCGQTADRWLRLSSAFLSPVPGAVRRDNDE